MTKAESDLFHYNAEVSVRKRMYYNKALYPANDFDNCLEYRKIIFDLNQTTNTHSTSVKAYKLKPCENYNAQIQVLKSDYGQPPFTNTDCLKRNWLRDAFTSIPRIF
jgi:hypothetical protein